MSDNLALWNAVEKTDPKYTKAFNRPGGFSGTAINATYLIRKATEQWGPMGGKWGPIVEDEKYVPGADGTVIHVLRIRFRHPDGEFHAYGQTTFVGKNKNGIFTDEEAPKKSMTDAITKSLAMLGFSADVFLGLYDDNKYIADRKAEFANLPSSAKSIAADAWDNLEPDEQKFLQGIVDSVRARLEGPLGVQDAVTYLEAQKLDNDEKICIWSRFDSKERSALKLAGKKVA